MPFSGIFRDIDEKERKDPTRFWIHAYILVFTIPLGCGVLLYLILYSLGYSTDLDSDSTRYLLSALIQSLAAIIAIVVTLTLVAIQFTASVYSTRIIDFFKNTPATWAMLSAYIIAIAIVAYILMSITSSQLITDYKNLSIFYSYFLFIALTIILIPYIRVTINHLNAEEVITRLISQIDIQKIEPKIDPFQPAFDVIYGAIIKDDYSSMSHGLVCVKDKFLEVLAEVKGSRESEYIFLRFFNDIKRCAFKLINKDEELFVLEILNRMDDIVIENEDNFEKIILKNNPYILKYWIETVVDISCKASPKKMGYVISHCIGKLDILTENIETNPPKGFDISLIPDSYKKSCIAFIQNDYEYSALECIKKIAICIDNNLSSNIAFSISGILALKEIIRTCFFYQEKDIKDSAVRALYKTYVKADLEECHLVKENAELAIIELKEYHNLIPNLEDSLIHQPDNANKKSDYNKKTLQNQLEKFKEKNSNL